MIEIYNVRFGIATNSSSSHSMVFMDSKTVSDDHQGAKFGWDFFTLASKDSKRLYAAAALFEAIPYETLDFLKHALVKEWSGIDLYEFADRDDLHFDVHIDHQSRPLIPCDLNGNIHEEYFKEYMEYISQDGIVILGGNDNDGYSHNLAGNPHVNLGVPIEETSKDWIARKDDIYKYWVLYNKINGTKVRFRFGEGEIPHKSFAPELVDMKITDFCNMGCQFCYQSSTPNGIHGNKSYISGIIRELGHNGVFELALGGGTAESHPDFIDILCDAKFYDINVTFTTKSLAWFYDPHTRKRVLENISAFAYSVDNEKSIRKLGTFIEANEIFDEDEVKNKVNIQVVLGVVSHWDLKRILEECNKFNFRVTLLGFKDVGFGKGFRKQPYDEWIDVIKKMEYDRPDIAIDTALAKEFEQQIVDSKIPKYLFHTEEGKFSCYIDAVQKKIAPSSYCDNSEFIDCTPDDFINKFREF